MAGEIELAFGIAALVYAAGLALFRLPLFQLRRWGWTLMTHSWSAVAVIAVVGSLAVIKSLLANYLPGLGIDVPLAATFDDAIASASASRDMALSWVRSLSYAGVALGMLQALLMVALAPTWATGVGIILSAIASYLVSAVFGLLIFITKVLSGVVLFMEGVMAFVGMSKVIAPAMFVIGCALFAVPFARGTGKTLMVLGAALTLGLPVAIVAASPPPGYADQRIQESAEVQALSIAGRAISDLQAGVRYTAYDRENDTLWYPFLLAEPLGVPEIDRSKACENLPRNITCEYVLSIIEGIIRTSPEKAIFDTGGGGYYDAYREGYRMPVVNNTYARRVWFLNMWVTLYDPAPRNVTGPRIPEEADEEVMHCVNSDPFFFSGWDGCDRPYEMWRGRWERFWASAPLYNETSLWMVAANRNTTFVWFTEQPWGTPRENLNLYGITLPKIREERWTEEETYECETDGNATTVETCSRTKYYTKADYSGNKSVYFVYVSMNDGQVCWDVGPIYGGPVNGTRVCETRRGTPSWGYSFTPLSDEPAWNHTVLGSSFEEIMAAGFIDGFGPYVLRQSVQSVSRDEPLVLEAPTEEKKVFVRANRTIVAWSYEGHPELPSRLDYSFRVTFAASESTPYLPEVQWDKFDEDEDYTRRLARGEFAPDAIAGIRVDSQRQYWELYRNFRQGLYRDGPAHESARRITQKLLEYREDGWENNATLFGTSVPVAKAVTALLYQHAYGAYRGSDIRIEAMPLLITEGGSVAVLKPLAELIGQSFAIGLAIGLLALIIDSFQALVGGQSVMMKFVLGKVGNISHAMKFFAAFAAAVHRTAAADVPGRALARMQENQLLKSAFEARKADRQRWAKAVERKMEQRNVFAKAAAKYNPMAAERMEKLTERIEELEQRGGMAARLEKRLLETVTRSYRLHAAAYAVRTDPKFAETVRDKYYQRLIAEGKKPEDAVRKADGLIDWVKQSKTVGMEPTKFAEGLANMMRNENLTTFEKVALADSFAKSDFGRTILRAGILQPIGMASEAIATRLQASGHFAAAAPFSWAAQNFDGRIRAPAAFEVAAQFPSHELSGRFSAEGVTPQVTPGYVPTVRVGVLHPPSDARIPEIKQRDFGGSVEDIAAAESRVREFGDPSDIKAFQQKLGDYAWLVAEPEEPGFKLTSFIEARENPLSVTAQLGREEVQFQVSRSDLEHFAGFLEREGFEILSASSRPQGASAGDAQPAPVHPLNAVGGEALAAWNKPAAEGHPAPIEPESLQRPGARLDEFLHGQPHYSAGDMPEWLNPARGAGAEPVESSSFGASESVSHLNAADRHDFAREAGWPAGHQPEPQAIPDYMAGSKGQEAGTSESPGWFSVGAGSSESGHGYSPAAQTPSEPTAPSEHAYQRGGEVADSPHLPSAAPGAFDWAQKPSGEWAGAVENALGGDSGAPSGSDGTAPPRDRLPEDAKPAWVDRGGRNGGG